MKTIGLLGWAPWASTITYYKLLNEMVNERLGGDHNARILLRSIDYHEIKSNYAKDHQHVADLVEEELQGLIALKPDCILICNNTLHKYYDIIKGRLASTIPVFHATELVAQELHQKNYQHVLLLATKNTLEDGFFARKLEGADLHVTIPNEKERLEIHHIINRELVKNEVSEESKKFFSELIHSYHTLDAVVLGCTELPLAVQQGNSVLPVINSIFLQCKTAVEYALQK